MGNYFCRLSLKSWIVRIILASILYLPIYLFFGGLISPFVIPYYSDPTLNLKIPSVSLIIPLELIRGFIFVGILLPWYAILKFTRKQMAVVVTLLLYISGGLVPLLMTNNLPTPIIPYHMIEIFCDSLVFGTVTTMILKFRDEKNP